MATVVGIVGETGSGKSHAIQFLPSDKTFIFDCDKKGLPFRHWKTKYNSENKNYYRTSDIKRDITPMLKRINKESDFSHIKYIVLDTMNGIMIDDEMSRMKEKTYDKWQDLATSVYYLLDLLRDMREDLIIFTSFHLQDISDDFGNHFYRILTSGQKLQKIKLESKLPIVLFSVIEEGDEGKNRYFFETQARKSTAKSPVGMFKEFKMPNNLLLVAKAIEKYETAPEEEQKNKSEDEQTEQ